MKLSALLASLLFTGMAPVEANVRDHGHRRLRSRNLQEFDLQLVGFGGQPNQDRLPLHLCQGDCDFDFHCAAGLVCFQREPPMDGESWPEVPGCIGGRQFTAQTDFCILAPVEGIVVAPTSTPSMTPTTTTTTTKSPTKKPTFAPTNVPSIDGETVGPTTATPSLMPSDESYWDLPELDVIGVNGNSQGMPLGICESDCDTDEDCLDELICYHRGFASEEPIPGCRGEPHANWDYCILSPVVALPESTMAVTMSPTVAETMAATEMIVALHTVGDNNTEPLGLCQGDCDDDKDCLDDFVCFKRNYLEDVPGCIGKGNPSYDYCINNPVPPTSATTTFSPTTESSSSFTAVPVVVVVAAAIGPPTAQPTESPATFVEPPMLTHNAHKGKDGPLGLCEGKCRDDADCLEGLVCLQRDSDDEVVPGCAGSPHKADDYCIEP